MAEAGVLPQVIAIIGHPFWKYACESFRVSPPFKRFSVTGYRWCNGKSLHFANRITLESDRGRHELLLVRLRHPSAARHAPSRPGRTPIGLPQWLFEQADFLEIANAVV